MNEQEAQQAKTIAGIKLWFSLGRSTMKSSVEVEARKKVSELLEIVDSQAQKIEATEEKLHRILEWCKAYPIEVFPEPDFNLANNVLRQGGIATDAIAASMARHIMGKLQELLK